MSRAESPRLDFKMPFGLRVRQTSGKRDYILMDSVPSGARRGRPQIHYKRRDPEKTDLHRLVRTHFPAIQGMLRERFDPRTKLQNFQLFALFPCRASRFIAPSLRAWRAFLSTMVNSPAASCTCAARHAATTGSSRSRAKSAGLAHRATAVAAR